jgi:hypothetical protein
MSMDIEKTQLRSFYLELSILFLRNFHDTPNRASAKFTKTFGVSVRQHNPQIRLPTARCCLQSARRSSNRQIDRVLLLTTMTNPLTLSSRQHEVMSESVPIFLKSEFFGRVAGSRIQELRPLPPFVGFVHVFNVQIRLLTWFDASRELCK